MYYQLCEIYRCKIWDVVATAGILRCTKYFLLYHHPQVFYISHCGGSPSETIIYFDARAQRLIKDFRLVMRSAAIKWISNAIWAFIVRASHLGDVMEMECSVNIEIIFPFKAVGMGGEHTVLLHRALYYCCCFFQWQMSSFEYANGCFHITVHWKPEHRWRSPKKEAPENDCFQCCILHRSKWGEWLWLTCVYVLSSSSSLLSWMLGEAWWWRWLGRT